jgi:tetratricopeptide (TPR) repeat protein
MIFNLYAAQFSLALQQCRDPSQELATFESWRTNTVQPLISQVSHPNARQQLREISHSCFARAEELTAFFQGRVISDPRLTNLIIALKNYGHYIQEHLTEFEQRPSHPPAYLAAIGRVNRTQTPYDRYKELHFRGIENFITQAYYQEALMLINVQLKTQTQQNIKHILLLKKLICESLYKPEEKNYLKTFDSLLDESVSNDWIVGSAHFVLGYTHLKNNNYELALNTFKEALKFVDDLELENLVMAALGKYKTPENAESIEAFKDLCASLSKKNRNNPTKEVLAPILKDLGIHNIV